MGSCGFLGSENAPAVSPDEQQEWDKTLTFNDVTLEQANPEGKIVWKVRSPKAAYNDERKITDVETPEGELFQDGKLVYRIQAKRGQVYGDGSKIVLQDDIVAFDLQHDAVLRAEELEWLPQEDLLVVRNNLRGTHPKFDVSGNEARLQSRTQQMELLGNGVGTTKQQPVLQVRSDRILWQMDTNVVSSDRPVEVDRYLCDSPQQCPATDLIVADRGTVNLETNTVTLEQKARATLAQPPLTVESDSMVWNVDAETVTSDRPVRVVHRQQQFTFKGDRGNLALEPQIVDLFGNVTGVGTQRQSDLQADRIRWFIPTEQFEAEGNVVYRQIDPAFMVSGPYAEGQLQEKIVKVTGGNVVTEVVPD